MRLENFTIPREDIENIHRATVRVLEEVGVEFFHDKALEVFRNHGAKVEGNKVFITEELLNKALSTAPETFIWKGLKSDVVVGGDNTITAPFSGVIKIREKDEVRTINSEDFIKITKLIESSKVMDVHNPNILVPLDIEEEKQRQWAMATTLKYATKPLIGFTTTKKDAIDSIAMAQEFYNNKEDHLLMGIISPLSPLAYDGVMLDSLMEYADKNQSLMIACCSLPGATSPVTIGGTLVVNSAEVLAGIVFAQLYKPGTAVVYGNTSGSCDMRYATPAIGSPETALITYAVAELARFYKIPSRTGGALVDSKLVDMQAGIESTVTVLPPYLGCSNMVLHACGILDSFNMFGYEKYMVDEEIVTIAKRLKKGIDTSEEALAVDLIKKIGPQGQFLEEEHTASNYRNEHFFSKMFVKEGIQAWEKNGAETLTDRAYKEYEKRITKFKAKKLTEREVEILNRYL